ncbi:MAG: twin-arginine translocase TatA/TatE family subunit [Bdellovibrionales bacterium]|nr:twin-arginine translocase TatA/TatE family subunit [Bdellovibrionales bacterium]
MSPSLWQILIVVGIFVLLFMGPKRLPAALKSLGEGIRDFKKGLDGDEIDVTDSVKRQQMADKEKEAAAQKQKEKETT